MGILDCFRCGKEGNSQPLCIDTGPALLAIFGFFSTGLIKTQTVPINPVTLLIASEALRQPV